MSLHLYDTVTREEREFTPLVSGRVGIYLCGPTVQSSPHIGHLRATVAFDVLQRWLERSGYEVTMVRNVTDIDDKILAKSAEAGVPWTEWARRYEREFQEAYGAVGVAEPAVEPRVTEHIDEIVALTERIIANGFAYEKDGSVNFDVRAFPEYGALTRQRLDDLPSSDDLPGYAKRDPRDFALWKGREGGADHDSTWDSPWGRGRPGWHIECSAMAQRYLGEEFDIHGGGLDLRFPHHENEQAQSHAAGYGFARLWMHSAWVTQSGEKMSKSLGNGLLVSEVLSEYPAAALRLALAVVHYRSMIEYTPTTLDEALAQWERLSGFVTRAGERVGQPPLADVAAAPVPALFAEAMDDDLAVPRAFALVHEAVRAGNTALAEGDDAAVAAALIEVRVMLDVLGLDPESPQWATGVSDAAVEAALASLVASGAEVPPGATLDEAVSAELEARAAARAAKDWAAADAIRDRLAAAGITIEDAQDGARWSLA